MFENMNFDDQFNLIPVFLFGVGVLVVFFGARNLRRTYLGFNSPLDQAGSVQARPAPDMERGEMPTEQTTHSKPFDPQQSSQEEVDREAVHTQNELVDKDLRWMLPDGQEERTQQLIPDSPRDDLERQPDRLVIEELGIDAPVVPVRPQTIEYQGETYQRWSAPREQAVGWHRNSARLGRQGNTVLNGHSSGFSEIFRNLQDVENGDIIHIYAGELRFDYAVASTRIFKERWEPVETRLKNARWIMSSADERLTLVSCWPFGSNTHRVVVVAVPLDVQPVNGNHG